MLCEPKTYSLCHFDVPRCACFDTTGLRLVQALRSEGCDARGKATIHQIGIHPIQKTCRIGHNKASEEGGRVTNVGITKLEFLSIYPSIHADHFGYKSHTHMRLSFICIFSKFCMNSCCWCAGSCCTDSMIQSNQVSG
jgi:hypothetical protein